MHEKIVQIFLAVLKNAPFATELALLRWPGRRKLWIAIKGLASIDLYFT